MHSLHSNCQFSISLGFCVAVIGFMLIFPLNWLLAWLVSAGVHEAGHFIACVLCKKRIFSMRIHCGGACIETELCGGITELICVAAGPLFGASLILVMKWFPRLAICALLQTAYNMLPICGLDGGRILQSILGFFVSPKRVSFVSDIINWTVLICALSLSVIVTCNFDFGILPIIGALMLVCRSALVKYPCKHGKIIVQ